MGRKKVQKGKRSNNEGSLYQMSNGKWRCMLSLGFKEDGSRNRVSMVFDTEGEAKAWKTKQLATVQEYGNESVKTTNELFAYKYHKWLIDVKMPEIYSQSFTRMMSDYNKHIKPYFLKFKQRDLTQEDFQKFFRKLEEKKVGAETRRKMKGVLHQYFEKEFANSPMRNPLDGVRTATKKKAELINPDEVIFNNDYKAVPKDIRKQFLVALDKDKQSPFIKPLCYLMYFAGNRIGETLAFQWKDFNFEKRYFLVYKAVTIDYEFDENGNKISKAKTIVKAPKTKKGIRPLPLLDILNEVLQEWYNIRKAQEKLTGISFTAPDDYIFANNLGELRSRWGTNTIFRRFLERNNLNNKGIHFHALRQTFSNSLFAEDSEDKVITDLLGHEKISTSKEHYHSTDRFDSVQKAARIFNARYKPKNPKYCAGDDVTFAPDGHISEEEAPLLEATQTITPPADDVNTKRSIIELLNELASYPEFQEIFSKMPSNKIVKAKSEVEAE